MLFGIILAQIQETYIEVGERQQYNHNSSSTKDPQNFPQLQFLLLATQIGELNRATQIGPQLKGITID
mgnify:CR=1 FL=1